MVQQSLYRRYRPRRFGEVRGQDHVVEPLRNAVRSGSAGQAYLFSGPRGTGKTTTARILAKALNCENPADGEPCCECTACVDMQEGRSFDLFELDAASNNGVDAIRDLIERAAVGSPGRTKVYILDEVHMLSTGASNALLKTLEEPPDHVRFVLATTDPHKVLPTIRSRTQHFDFQLLSAEELEAQVREIVADAGLDVGEEGIAWAVQQGRGSSRDTLSALDKVAAAGGVVRQSAPVDSLFEALSIADAGAAVLAVSDATGSGHDPRVLASAFVDSLRDAFMVSFGAATPHLVAAERSRSEQWATALGTPLLTRAMETVGSAIVDMRNAPDPRVPLEVALVLLTSAAGSSATSPAAGSPAAVVTAPAPDVAALVARIERLERALGDGGHAAARVDTAAGSPGPERSAAVPDDAGDPQPRTAAEPAEPAEDMSFEGSSSSTGGPAAARAELARLRSQREGAGPTKASTSPSPSASPAPPPVPGSPPPRPVPPTPPGQPVSAPVSDGGRRIEDRNDEPFADDAPRSSERPAAADLAPDSPLEGESSSGDSGDAPGEPSPASTAPPAGSGKEALTADHVSNALADSVVPEMKGVAKAIYGVATVEAVSGDSVTLGLQAGALERGEKSRAEVEAALADKLGRQVKVSLVLAASAEASGRGPKGRSAGPAGSEVGDLPPDDVDDDVPLDVNDLEDATDVASSGIDRLTRAFPGAQVADHDQGNP